MKFKQFYLLAFLAASFAGFAADSIKLPVAVVEERPYQAVRRCPGRVVPIAQVKIVPQVTGEVLEVCFRNGEKVSPGDVLYRLDSVKYQAAVKNAEAKVAECAANVKYAENSYERHRRLSGTRAVSLDAVDNALSQRDSARAALTAAQAELQSARDDLKHCTIVAPIEGRVGSTAVTEGNYVLKGSEALVTIVQSAPIRVRFSIANREYLDLFGADEDRIRDEATISLQLANGESYSEGGSVEYVDNESDELTDTIRVYAVFMNAQGLLKPSGTVTVTLSSQQGVMRPGVPTTAILQDVQGPYVWVVRTDGTAERRSVARGDVDDGFLFVEKGLKAGERVVADGGHKVRRGMKIEAVE